MFSHFWIAKLEESCPSVLECGLEVQNLKAGEAVALRAEDDVPVQHLTAVQGIAREAL